MRGLLRRGGARAGVSAGLVVTIAAVVLVARLVGDNNADPGAFSQPDTVPSTAVSAGDDGQVAPSPTASTDDTDIRSAASTFIQSWLQRALSAEAWHAGLVPLTTTSLAESLVGVDPVGVPATRTTSAPTVTLRSDQYAQVTVPVDTGAVDLGLLKQGDRWLVDSVDWQRT